MQTERTFEHGVLTITVRRMRVRDRVTADIVKQKLERAGAGNVFTRHTFARLVGQSKVQGMAWVDELSTDEELRAAHDAVMDDDGALYDKWSDALDAVNAPMNDEALIPADQMTDSEKKDTPSEG